MSANSGATGDRNKSVKQYGVCLAVEYYSPLRRSRLPVFVASPKCRAIEIQLRNFMCVFSNEELDGSADSALGIRSRKPSNIGRSSDG
jgi:hypothetical protein